MRHRMLTLGFVVASALSVTAPAIAQYAPQRYPNSGYNQSYGYQNGYREGQREGERDARDGKDYGYKRDDAYEDADRGFRGGNKGAYKADFRRGYEDGYDLGYRRSGGYGRGGGVFYPRPSYGNGGYQGGYPNRDRDGIPETRRERVAFDNGYSDGYDAGRRDADRRRSFDPYNDGRYKSANRGYDSNYGGRDWYRDEYRNGFRSGYEAGFRNERRR